MAKYTAPNLENTTPEFLIDEIGRLRSEQKRLAFLEGVYKEALEARCTTEQRTGIAFIQGTIYLGNRTKQEQYRISAEKVQDTLKDEPHKLALCYNKIEFWQLSVNPIITEV